MTHQLPATARISLGGMALLLVLAGSALPAAASPADTSRTPVEATVEEQRLDRAAPQEILRRSGFDTFAPRFERALKHAKS
ncbi:pyroglutamyl peptidase, partial [Streptomyces sp. SID7982]|nr:pyroglutamyl peptidase [Streptomyces sp. SID7982]